MSIARWLLVIGVVLPAFAADLDVADTTAKLVGIPVADLLQQMKDCDRDQTSMNLCARYQLVAAEKAMKASVDSLLSAKSEDVTKDRFRAAQLAWMNYRESNCAYEAVGVEGGSLHAFIELNCKTRMTQDRTAQIRESLRCTAPGCPP